MVIVVVECSVKWEGFVTVSGGWRNHQATNTTDNTETRRITSRLCNDMRVQVEERSLAEMKKKNAIRVRVLLGHELGVWHSL